MDTPSLACVADATDLPRVLQPLTLEEMRLSEGGGAGSLSLSSFEPEFMRPVPPMLPIADSEVRRRGVIHLTVCISHLGGVY